MPTSSGGPPGTDRGRVARVARSYGALAAALLAATVTLTTCDSSSRPDRRPNVLLLVMDTCRADRCSFEGYGRPTTPRLDELARDAVVFRDAWSPDSWTGPAHATLFTGLRPEHHGFHPSNACFLGEGRRTLAERLDAAGYATGCFTNNDWISPKFGLSRGFATYANFVDMEKDERTYPWAHDTHARAAQWAEEVAASGRPFFLFVNDIEPHVEYAPAAQDQARFVRGNPSADEIAWGRAFDGPRSLAHSLGVTAVPQTRLPLLSDLYDAEIAGLDREIGVLLDRFRASGLLDRTVVVVVGDHGESLGEHGIIGHGYDLHRAICRVPLLVRFPGAFDGGRAVDSVVRLEDVAPTILELCGASTIDLVDGVPLTRDLGGRIALGSQRASNDVRDWLADAVPGCDPAPFAAGIGSVYDGRWHLVAWTDGREALYDVTRDPDELTDLAERERDVAGRLFSTLRTAMSAAARGVPRGRATAAELAARLR